MEEGRARLAPAKFMCTKVRAYVCTNVCGSGWMCVRERWLKSGKYITPPHTFSPTHLIRAHCWCWTSPPTTSTSSHTYLTPPHTLSPHTSSGHAAGAGRAHQPPRHPLQGDARGGHPGLPGGSHRRLSRPILPQADRDPSTPGESSLLLLLLLRCVLTLSHTLSFFLSYTRSHAHA
jgi:hypothetical protein